MCYAIRIPLLDVIYFHASLRLGFLALFKKPYEVCISRLPERGYRLGQEVTKIGKPRAELVGNAPSFIGDNGRENNEGALLG